MAHRSPLVTSLAVILFVRPLAWSSAYKLRAVLVEKMCLSPIHINTKLRDNDGTLSVGPVRVVSCGKCVECLQRKADEWAFRCMVEAKQHEFNCMLTLTYNDYFLPEGGTLVRKDLTDFIKRLRERIAPTCIRVFYSGEYGSIGMRPHYHVIVFGWRPPDLTFLQVDKSGVLLYRSRFVESVWSKTEFDEFGYKKRYSMGYISVGDVTFKSARYCAKYLQKLVQYPDSLLPPFIGMSNRPGIGACGISPQILLDGGIWYNGKNIPIPRYYLKVLSESHDLDDWNASRVFISEFRQRVSDPYLKKVKERGKKILEKLLTKS